MLKIRNKREKGRGKGILAFCFLFLVACSVGSQDPAPVRHYGVEKGAGSVGAFTVLEGDTLWRVSKRFKIDMRDLVEVNHLSEPYVLSVGQRLQLPPPREYSVQGGDTLYTVSRLFDVSATDLARLNNIDAPYVIHTREVLRLPSPSSAYAIAGDEVEIAEQVQDGTGRLIPGRKPDRSGVVRPGVKPRSSRKTVKAPRSKIPSRTPKRSSGKFLSPVRGRIISSYGAKKNGLHNDGINIKAPRGAPVRAAENGVVVYSGSDLKGTGNLILVRHRDRWMSAYAHLGKRAVKRGQVVKRGQSIGTVGSSGSVDSPQLHFELRRGTKALNPKVYLEG